jgi:hypothetical protein
MQSGSAFAQRGNKESARRGASMMNMTPTDRWMALLGVLFILTVVLVCGIAIGGSSCAASVF